MHNLTLTVLAVCLQRQRYGEGGHKTCREPDGHCGPKVESWRRDGQKRPPPLSAREARVPVNPERGTL